MRRQYHRQKMVAEINITPFTDVILVLLVIFMITTPLLSQSGLKLNLPEASAVQPLHNKAQISINITREGSVYVKNKLISDKELRGALSAVCGGNQDLVVILNVDSTAQFKNAVKVLDVLNGLGIRKINIAALSENKINNVIGE